MQEWSDSRCDQTAGRQRFAVVETIPSHSIGVNTRRQRQCRRLRRAQLHCPRLGMLVARLCYRVGYGVYSVGD
jgi:hypothetical protein